MKYLHIPCNYGDPSKKQQAAAMAGACGGKPSTLIDGAFCWPVTAKDVPSAIAEVNKTWGNIIYPHVPNAFIADSM